MTTAMNSTLVSALEAAAAQAGLVLVSATEGSDFHGLPTAVFQLGLPGADARSDRGTPHLSLLLKRLPRRLAWFWSPPPRAATFTASPRRSFNSACPVRM